MEKGAHKLTSVLELCKSRSSREMLIKINARNPFEKVFYGKPG
jgi:hypothetical protein